MITIIIAITIMIMKMIIIITLHLIVYSRLLNGSHGPSIKIAIEYNQTSGYIQEQQRS